MSSLIVNKLMFDYEDMLNDEIMNLSMQVSRKILRWLIGNHPDNRIRLKLLKLTNIQVGDGSVINKGFMVDDNYEKCVQIGNRVAIGANVHIISKSSPNNSLLLDKLIHLNIAIKNSFVCIDNDAWIGAGSIILPGVVVGQGSIVGAGSVVTKSIEQGIVVAGNPARLLYRI